MQRRDDEPASGGGGSSTGTQDPDLGGNDSASARLGDCLPGTPMVSAQSCSWYAKQTCYSTKEAACNCICPLDVGEVVCASELQDEGTPSEVYCYGL